MALGQVYIKDYLTHRFRKSLSPEMLNTAVFWAACSAWASTTKKSVSDKLYPIIVTSLHAIKVSFSFKLKHTFIWIIIAQYRKGINKYCRITWQIFSPTRMNFLNSVVDWLYLLSYSETVNWFDSPS